LSLQTDALYERLSPKEYLTFFKKLYGVHVHVDDLLEKTGLIDKKNIRSEKKRLHFARAILHDPLFIIFEDPTQNLDIESTLIFHRFISNLEDQGKVIFIT